MFTIGSFNCKNVVAARGPSALVDRLVRSAEEARDTQIELQVKAFAEFARAGVWKCIIEVYTELAGFVAPYNGDTAEMSFDLGHLGNAEAQRVYLVELAKKHNLPLASQEDASAVKDQVMRIRAARKADRE